MSTLPKEIKLKMIGKVVTTTILQKSYKISLDAEAKTKLKDLVEKFNKKPSEFWLNKIIKTFTPVVKADKKVSENKLIKNKLKKEVKEVKKKAKVVKEAKEVLSTVVESVRENAVQKENTVQKEADVQKLEKLAVTSTPVYTPRTRGREY